MQNFKTYSLKQLQTRYAHITKIIATLAENWRAGGTTVEIAVNWRFDEPGLRSIDLKLFTDESVDVFRQFIHDLCTKLCAEKLEIECELIDRDQPIFTNQ
jgi:hypothetical protein